MEKFSCHFANGSSQTKGIDFDHSYSPMVHDDSFRINISIADMHILTARILDRSNSFQNINVPIHERFYVRPPPCYLDCFENSYLNLNLN